MPRLVHGESRTTEVARVVNDILAEDGIPALTMRTIAARLRLSPSTLHVHHGSRDRTLRAVEGRGPGWRGVDVALPLVEELGER